MARSIFAPSSQISDTLAKPYTPLEQREEIRLPENRISNVIEAMKKEQTPKPLMKAEERYFSQLGKEPTSTELPDYLQIQPKAVDAQPVEEDEEKPLTNKEKIDLAESYAKGALNLGKGAYEMIEAERLGKLNAELMKKKGEFEAASDVTSGKVGAVGNYIANLRAALGRKV
jgi:hypothetical protein